MSQGEGSYGATFEKGSASVFLHYVTVNAASKLINYRQVDWLELKLNENNDPQELGAAMRILFRGWKHTMQYLEVDDVPDATRIPNQPSLRSLKSCLPELGDLPALESFTTRHMYFDDALLQSVCENERLDDINIGKAQITKQAIEILGACHTLKRISIDRCPKFPQAYESELASHFPKADFVVSVASTAS